MTSGIPDAVPGPDRRRWLAYARGWRVPVHCRLQHAVVVRSRVRGLAIAIALLVLAWIPIDAYGLQATEFLDVLALRVGLAAGLILLSHASRRWSPDAATIALFWLQALAFAAMELCLLPADGNVLRVGYGLFPIVVGSQLAILPLSLRCALFAALAAVAASIAPFALGAHAPSAAQWDQWWLLAIVLLFATIAGHSQLQLLADLLGARRDASHDPLTGLANRRFAEHRLQADRARAMREPEPLSVLMVDIDHFKQVNDRWGHARGDRVLEMVARVLREELRGADLGVRHGGEEFLAILPGTGSEGALEVAERLRARIENARVLVEDGEIALTASIGIATFRDGESGNELVARADAALYRAKASGRNRCMAAVPGEPAPPPRERASGNASA